MTHTLLGFTVVYPKLLQTYPTCDASAASLGRRADPEQAEKYHFQT